MSPNFYRGIAGAVALAVAMTACKKTETGENTMREVPPATSAAPAPTGVEVTSLQLGRALGADGNVVQAMDNFSPRDTIYAVAHTTGMATGATLSARWTYSDGQVVDESSQAISPSGPATTEFHVSKASGWPAGDYKVSIMLDGREVQSKEFKVGS